MWVIGMHRSEKDHREWKVKTLLNDYYKPKKFVADRLHKHTYRFLISNTLYGARLFKTKKEAVDFIKKANEKNKSSYSSWGNKYYTYADTFLEPCELPESKVSYIMDYREKNGIELETNWDF